MPQIRTPDGKIIQVPEDGQQPLVGGLTFEQVKANAINAILADEELAAIAEVLGVKKGASKEERQKTGAEKVFNYQQQGLSTAFLKMLCNKESGVLSLPVGTALKRPTNKAQAIAALDRVTQHPSTDFSPIEFIADQDVRYFAANMKTEFPDSFEFSPDKTEQELRIESNETVIDCLSTIASINHDEARIETLIKQSPDAGRSEAPQPTQATIEAAQAFTKEYVTCSAQTFQQENSVTVEAVEAQKIQLPAPTSVKPQSTGQSRAEREKVELMRDIQANIAFAMAGAIVCRQALHNPQNQNASVSLRIVTQLGEFRERIVDLTGLTSTPVSLQELETENLTPQQEDRILEQTSGVVSRLMSTLGMFKNPTLAGRTSAPQSCAQEASADLPPAHELQQFILRGF